MNLNYKQMIKKIEEITTIKDIYELLIDEKKFAKKYSTKEDILILFKIIENNITKIEKNKELDYYEAFEIFKVYLIAFFLYEYSKEKNILHKKIKKTIKIEDLAQKLYILIINLEKVKVVEYEEFIKNKNIKKAIKKYIK